MIQYLKKYFLFIFKKKLIQNYFYLKNNKKFDLLPEFEKDFINTDINLDFKYLKEFYQYYNIDLNLTLKQLLYEKYFFLR